MSWLPADVLDSALFTWLVVPLLIFVAAFWMSVWTRYALYSSPEDND
jgi:hypothetical protein